MKIDSEHLEILAVIVEKGGLTEGAEALGKSQPSVSRTMALLEERIGTPLFEAGRRPLRPTELGNQLARLGAKIRAQNLEASRLVQRYRQGQAGRLRLGGTPIFFDGVVAGMVADFQNRHSDVQITQTYGYFEELSAGLRSGALDLAILPMHANMIPADMQFTPLLAGRNVIVGSATHPLARRGAITLADIEPYSWIAPPPNSPLFRDLQRSLKSIGLDDFKVSFSGGTLASIFSVVLGSDSLTVLPYSVVFTHQRVIPLQALPLRIEHPDRQLGLLTATERMPPPALERFVAFVTEKFKHLSTRMEHEQQVTRRRG
ncbi:LysR family transcriptional regulator [Agrobacterium vitis]|uniref:LysR family transcriptional regulator n=1 Tax=Agrobacterium vitis TaxID=373 RepID=UPI0012E79401|nr:LysR family transcriptional regulator [Agrobacterium vitis]MVA81594.1 LysR family transcriptional regulator [Agrobacterium vitis]